MDPTQGNIPSYNPENVLPSMIEEQTIETTSQIIVSQDGKPPTQEAQGLASRVSALFSSAKEALKSTFSGAKASISNFVGRITASIPDSVKELAVKVVDAAEELAVTLGGDWDQRVSLAAKQEGLPLKAADEDIKTFREEASSWVETFKNALQDPSDSKAKNEEVQAFSILEGISTSIKGHRKIIERDTGLKELKGLTQSPITRMIYKYTTTFVQNPQELIVKLKEIKERCCDSRSANLERMVKDFNRLDRLMQVDRKEFPVLHGAVQALHERLQQEIRRDLNEKISSRHSENEEHYDKGLDDLKKSLSDISSRNGSPKILKNALREIDQLQANLVKDRKIRALREGMEEKAKLLNGELDRNENDWGIGTFIQATKELNKISLKEYPELYESAHNLSEGIETHLKELLDDELVRTMEENRDKNDEDYNKALVDLRATIHKTYVDQGSPKVLNDVLTEIDSARSERAKETRALKSEAELQQKVADFQAKFFGMQLDDKLNDLGIGGFIEAFKELKKIIPQISQNINLLQVAEQVRDSIEGDLDRLIREKIDTYVNSDGKLKEGADLTTLRGQLYKAYSKHKDFAILRSALERIDNMRLEEKFNNRLNTFKNAFNGYLADFLHREKKPGDTESFVRKMVGKTSEFESLHGSQLVIGNKFIDVVNEVCAENLNAYPDSQHAIEALRAAVSFQIMLSK